MGNNRDFNQKESFRMRPVFIVANLFIAIFLAIAISSFDNMSVRGGGFSVYAGPSDGSGEQLDENGEIIQGGSSVILVATNTPTSTPEISPTPSAESETVVTIQSENENGGTDTILPPVTATTEVVCVPPPVSWYEYVIQRGDRLGDIANRAGTSIEALQQANCLPDTSINFGTILLVPNEIIDAITPFAFVCESPPAGWQPYTVQRGDNVFRISIGSGITRDELVKFNCLPSESVLVAGQIIYLPPNSTYLNGVGVGAGVATATSISIVPTVVPTETPMPSVTAQPTATETLPSTPTEEPERPEETPTLVTPERPLETPVPTQEATTEPTEPPTAVPTLVPTVPPTIEPTPIPTDAPSPISTEIPTEIPTATNEPTAIPVATETLIPTAVPTEPATPTGEPTISVTTEPTEEPTPET